MRHAFRVVRMVLSEAIGDKVHVRSGFLALWCIEAIVPLLLLGAAAAEPLGYEGVIVQGATTLLSGSVFGRTSDELERYLTGLLTEVNLRALGLTGVLSSLLITWQLFVAAWYDLVDLQWRRFRLPWLGQVPYFLVFVVWVVALLGGGVGASAALLGFGYWFLLPLPVLWSTGLVALAIRLTGGRDRTWTGALLGGLVGAVWWEILKTVMRLYAVSSFGTSTLATTYRALGFLPLFFLWMHLTWFSVLLAVVVARTRDAFRPVWRDWVRRSEGPRGHSWPTTELATRVVEELDDAPVTLSELAEGVDVHPAVLRSLLRRLQDLDVVRELAPNVFAATTPGQDSERVAEAWNTGRPVGEALHSP